MSNNHKNLIREEQQILDHLINTMDNKIMQLNKRITRSMLQKEKDKSQSLSDTYADLVKLEHDKEISSKTLKETIQIRDELYSARLELDYEDKDDGKTGTMDVKVGLHTYADKDKIFITSWLNPICRHFMLENMSTSYNFTRKDKHGIFTTHYDLTKKRNIDMSFDKVEDVVQMFPVEEEAEEIIADEFLKELASRRSEEEFKNIVFSIQQHQGEIIQLPFSTNLIVQGCAGSGKSMIMLHRLPILLFDNPNSLDRNNLYIITPSQAYIEMAESMRIDLEISDLKMGTIQQYYSYVIEKYKLDPKKYGEYRSYITIPIEAEQFVYSENCVDFICQTIRSKVENLSSKYTSDWKQLGLGTNISFGNHAHQMINDNILLLQRTVNEHEKKIREKIQAYRDFKEKADFLVRSLDQRQFSIVRSIERAISQSQKGIDKAEKELKGIIKEQHEVKYNNRINTIDAAKNRIAENTKLIETVKEDVGYFTILKGVAKKLKDQLKKLNGLDDTEKYDYAGSYQYKSYWDDLDKSFGNAMKILDVMGHPYPEYDDSTDQADLSQLIALIDDFKQTSEEDISLDLYGRIKNSITELHQLDDGMIDTVYTEVMDKAGVEWKDKSKQYQLKYSSYLYLQTVYQYIGRPNGVKESLISIDEAQNLSVEEYKLIKNVNDRNLVLNLFGDIHQHVENHKGIDSWEQVHDISNFKLEYLQENYRNEKQITEYCNNKFDMDMRPISLQGRGVHQIKIQSDPASHLIKLLRKAKPTGLSAIIVKDKDEANSVLKKTKSLNRLINDLTGGVNVINKLKWNLLTIDQAKGLEFGTVYVFSGRMSTNEKYIAYTRALDELFIYDYQLDMITIIDDTGRIPDPPTHQVKTNGKVKKKKKKKSTSALSNEGSVAEFFKNAGLNVKDDRKKSGFLWVIGEKQDIEEFVDQAIEKFGISGGYGSGKSSGFKQGWFTKTKK